MPYATMLLEGLALGALVAGLVVVWLLISERQERRRARTVEALERERLDANEWRYSVSWTDKDGVEHPGWPSGKLAEPCVMHGTGDGRVCRLCGQGHEVQP